MLENIGRAVAEEGREVMRRVLGEIEGDGLGEFWRWEFATR